MTKGNYSRLEVDGIPVRLLVGEPRNLYMSAHPLGSRPGQQWGPRWYCIIADSQEIGHVIRWNTRNTDWRIDIFNDGGREGRVENKEFGSRREAIEYVVRLWKWTEEFR